MSTPIKVVHGEVFSTVAAIKSFCNFLDETLAEQQREFQALFGDWHGPAREACELEQQKLREGMNQLKIAFTTVSVKLQAGVEDVQQADQRVAARFGSGV